MLSLLHVEDNPIDAKLIARHLQMHRVEAEIRRVDRIFDLVAALAERSWDLVIADYNVPGLPFSDILTALAGSLSRTPVILVSGSVGEERAVELLKEGVADFVLKDNLARLVPSIHRALQEFEGRRAKLEAERALRESEERLRMALSASSMGVWEWEVDSGRMLWSPECNDILGIADMGGRLEDFTALIHPEDLDETLRQADRMVRDGKPFSSEFRIICPDGTVRWLANFGQPVIDDPGRPQRIVGTICDVTARKHADERVKTLAVAVEQSPESVIITDVDGHIEYVNAAFVRTTGYSPAEILGQNSHWLTSDETSTATHAALWATLAEGRPWQGEFTNRRKDGGEYIEHAIISPLRDGVGRVSHYVAVREDVTEKIRLQAEIERHRHHLEELVTARTAELQATLTKLRDTQFAMDSVGIGVHWVDAGTGRLLYVNEAAAAMLGYSVEEMVGLTVLDIDADISSADFHEETENLRRRGGARLESHQITKDGRKLPVEVVIHFLPDRDDVGPQFIAFITDISERKAREQEMAEIQTELARRADLAEAATQAKSAFLANMSHEIRTPLNAVLGLAQLGMRDSFGRKSQQYFDRILDSGQGLLAVIDDILDFSKLQAGRMSLEIIAMSLGEIIDRAVQMVVLRAMAKNLRLSIEEAPNLPARCLGDPARLQQVLTNLLTNAIKFTPAGGAVTLVAERQGKELILAVSDTGVGIAAKAVERLFEPFEQADGSTTRQFGGTGLGLSISRQLVEMMAGSIGVNSTPGAGSRFEVRLPLLGAEPAEPTETVMAALAGLSAADVAALTRAFPRSQVVARGDPMPPEAGMLVMDGAALSSPDRRVLIDAALGRGLPVVAVMEPGQASLPPHFNRYVTTIERPLRTRHLRAAMTRHVPDSTAAILPARLAQLSILAAEDNEVNRLVLEDMLQSEGARVTLCENGRQALEALKERGEGSFDLVLTDIQMPEMDGYELARAVVALAPALPVVGLTAHALAEERARCLEAGMAEHLAKPVDLNQLVSTIARLARPRPAPSPEAGGTGASGPAAIATGFDGKRLEARYDGRREFARRLVDTVMTAHGGAPDQLRAAVSAGDLSQMTTLAHTVKGTAGNITAEPLRVLASEAERAARARRGDAALLARQLADTFAQLLVELAGYLDEGDMS